VPACGIPSARAALPAPHHDPVSRRQGSSSRPSRYGCVMPGKPPLCHTPVPVPVPGSLGLLGLLQDCGALPAPRGDSAGDFQFPALRRRVSRFEQDFICLERLGAGAFGEVWHCRHRIDGRDYAIKVVPFRGHGLGHHGANQAGPSRILREVQCWSRLSHANIARYNSAWVESDWGSQESWAGTQGLHSGHMSASSSTVKGSHRNGGAHRCAVSSDAVVEGSLDNVSSSSAQTDLSSCGFQWAIQTDCDSRGFGKEARDAPLSRQLSCQEEPSDEFASSWKSLRYDVALYVQSELCRRDTLQDWLHQRNSIAAHCGMVEPELWVKEALEIFAQCLHALDHMHSNDCVHRDLKPSNVFFSLDGVVRVGDFGLAKVLLCDQQSRGELHGHDARGSGVVGTLSYSSPEQLAAGSLGEVGFKSDIFSLGLIVAELFWPASTTMERVHLFEQLRSPRTTFDAAPETLLCSPFPALRDAVLAMTHPNPNCRPSARAVLATNLPDLLEEVSNIFGQELIPDMGWDGSQRDSSSPLVCPQPSPTLSYAQAPPEISLDVTSFHSIEKSVQTDMRGTDGHGVAQQDARAGRQEVAVQTELADVSTQC